MQEAAAKYQTEGFSRIYITCAGTNTQHFIDLKTMFGDMDLDDIDIGELETEATKELQKEAATAEEASVVTEHRPIPADKITQVFITSIPIPIEFRIPPEILPKLENVKEKSAKNLAKKITQFYYNC